jgi:methionyl-tRNA formyltransferase
MVNTTFFGTHSFSVLALQVLKANQNINLVAVVTTDDKKIGRKQILTPNPVKKWAIENNVEVIEFNESKDIFEKINKLNINLGIVCYFGYLISKQVIEKFDKGILNIHPSLLPDYRGAAPLEWAILNGEITTGVTLIKINEKFDKGEIIAQEKINLDYTKSKKDIYENLFTIGATLLQDNLDLYINGKSKLTQQANSDKLAPKLTKQDGYIDLLNTDKDMVERKIMALNPWPTTYTTLQNIADYHKLKPLKESNLTVQIVATEQHLAPQVRLKLLKPEGKDIMSWEEFKNGYLN